MGDVNQTKTCPLCAETIKAQAKVCPFCQARQGRFAAWRVQLLPLLSGLVLVGITGAACWWALPDIPAGGRNFTRHRSNLRVMRTSLERDKKKPEYWLTGYVTNGGNYPWRVHELELRLVDAQGSLLDVGHPELSESFVVPAGGEDAFRVSVGKLVFTNSGVVHQVRVQRATDGNLPPKPN